MNRIICGDVLTELRKFSTGSVNCVVTSPPYWGLRDYGNAPRVWGGNPDCAHVFGNLLPCHHPGQVEQTKWKDAEAAGKGQTAASGRLCTCGAWLGCFGLEPTPELYVEHAVEIFREVRRVLREDGTFWLNIGDSYSGYHGNSVVPNDKAPSNKPGYIENMRTSTVGVGGLKQKELAGIPWRVAFGLQRDGWFLRQDIIWHKPNVMPESVTDRCTKSHEYIFLLSKNPKYHYDNEAIKEPAQNWGSRDRKPGSAFVDGTPGRARQSGGKDCNFAERGRNCRDVWTITTRSYKGAHFATFPEELPRRCILAGCPPGGVVLDPFGGSGTTVKVAAELGRGWVMIELNPQYCDLARERLGLPPASNLQALFDDYVSKSTRAAQ